MIYANEIDQKTAHWLSCLPLQIDRIDTRSIEDVKASELEKFTQCHFFAGIGGWQYALQLAGWSNDVPVWTGSCPCQPFSSAGKHEAEADERHLWPQFYRLIRDARPPIIFGEQVASKLGRKWLAGVRLDLDELGYGLGAADLCAASVGAPHARQRLYWMAYASGEGLPIPKLKAGLRADEAWKEGVTTKQLRVPQGSGARQRARVKSGIRLLANGIPGRVDQLRGLGNAIVPQLAAAFIRSSIEALVEMGRKE